MKPIACYFSIFCFLLWLASACTDPTDIGADLLEGDEAEVGFTDTLTLRAVTLPQDTIISYIKARSYAEANLTYLFGDMQDPIFGNTKAQIYAQLALQGSSPRFAPTARVDSVVLVLPYNKSGMYGDLTETYGIAVHQLTTFINAEENYYSNTSFPSEAVPLGTKTFVPNLDSITIQDYNVGRKDSLYRVKVPAQLRIPLDAAFGQELINLDTNIYKTSNRDSTLVNYLKGIHLKPTTTTRGMLSFILPSNEDANINSRAGIFLYYTEQDTIKKQIQFDFDFYWARHTQIEHNYQGALVENYLNNPALADSLVFVQGMAGVYTDLEIPFVESLRGLAVNKAELELRIAAPPGDNGDLFKPIPFLRVLTPSASGVYDDVDDLALYRALQQQSINFYGGVPLSVTSGEPMVYRINLSTYLQNVINGRRTNKLRITVFDREQQAARVALYGTKHPQYGIKLKVAFTRPPG